MYLDKSSKSSIKSPKNKKNKKKKNKFVKSTTSTPAASETTIDQDPFTAALEICDKDTATLHKLPTDAKQQAFYALLVKGEMLLKEENPKKKKSELIDKAIEYFLKAVTLVPNPTQVIMAYEKTLPAEIFKRIIYELEAENKKKIKSYFLNLAPESGLIHFEEVEGLKFVTPVGSENASHKQWSAIATSYISEGTVLMSEESDIALCTLKDSQSLCDFCFKEVEESDKLLFISDLKYCSKFCLEKAHATYGKYFENLTGTSAYSYQQLVNVVTETKCYAPLLMLRYVATLLEDERSKQQSLDVAFDSQEIEKYHLFSHYDCLRPAYRAPRDSDCAEAMLIRKILQPQNNDIGEFLTDEIYMAMKSTVMFNAIGINLSKSCDSKKNVEIENLESVESVDVNKEIKITKISAATSPTGFKSIEPVRVASSTNQSNFFGLYHTYAHVSHSCDPNCQLVPDVNIPRRLKLVAKRGIKASEKITISYLQDECENNKNNNAREVLNLDFYINCDCINCA